MIDVNLPSRFSFWAGEEYEHVVHINDELKDSEIWCQRLRENAEYWHFENAAILLGYCKVT